MEAQPIDIRNYLYLKDTANFREVQLVLCNNIVIDINFGSAAQVDLKSLTFSAYLQRFPEAEFMILHSHPFGMRHFSMEDITTLEAWCKSFPKHDIRMGLVTLSDTEILFNFLLYDQSGQLRNFLSACDKRIWDSQIGQHIEIEGIDEDIFRFLIELSNYDRISGYIDTSSDKAYTEYVRAKIAGELD